jgi:cytochrome c-type biogenesis protein
MPLNEIFNALTMAMTDEFGIALAAAFGWGVLSILLSPCHLASIPLVVGYIVRQGPASARRSVGLSVTFAVGILITIALIGIITASIGRMMGDVGIWGNLIVAGVFLVVGLYLMDVIRFSWGSVAVKPIKGKPWVGALALGLIFGIGLGPCTFAYLAPVLGVVFSLASTSMASAVLLIAAFGIGHCSVIVGAGSLAHTVQKYLNWTDQSKGALWLKRVAGLFVLLAGVYFISTAF